jgi:hypothetical protein
VLSIPVRTNAVTLKNFALYNTVYLCVAFCYHTVNTGDSSRGSNQLVFLVYATGNYILYTGVQMNLFFKEFINRMQLKWRDCVSFNLCRCVTHAHNVSKLRPH